MAQTILVVAAHPDDELLGVGGTVIKHVNQGDKVYALILGQGLLARSGTEKAGLSDLQRDARRAGAIVGFTDMWFLDFPDNCFDTRPLLDIVKAVEAKLDHVKPDMIYTHHEYDLNIDHRLTFQAVLTASRPCNNNGPQAIYSFETLSVTEWQSKDQKQFLPTRYVAIGSELAQKIKALACYTTEMRTYPHARSSEGVEILAKWRGLEVGLLAAEAFQVVRQVKRDGV